MLQWELLYIVRFINPTLLFYFHSRMSSSCIHVTALLFRIEAANKSGQTNPACTSRECVWTVPAGKTVVTPQKICDMTWKASKLNKGDNYT